VGLSPPSPYRERDKQSSKRSAHAADRFDGYAADGIFSTIVGANIDMAMVDQGHSTIRIVSMNV